MSQPRNPYSVRADLVFTICSFLFLMLISSIARAILLTWNISLAEGIPSTDLARAFRVGLHFDLIICSIITLPIALGLMLPQGLKQRKIWLTWLVVMSSMILLTALVEPVFYGEFHARLNSLAIEYLNEDPGTVVSMIINGTPAFKLLFAWFAGIAICFVMFNKVDKNNRQTGRPGLKPWLVRVPVTFVLLLLLVIGTRGGTLRSGSPYRWGDAIHSSYPFANHLALNGTYTLVKGAQGLRDKKKVNDVWLHGMDDQKALDTTRGSVMQPQDQLLNPKSLALYRETTPTDRVLPENVKNVVFILMESFSAYFTADSGDKANITPYFDQLRKEGVLFDHAFSNGTHTHQGMFATFSCFPNTPGNEYLMQREEGHTHFSGYPPIMKSLGYKNNVYVYNGAFNWDNQEGFFRNQGIDRFIGRNQMENPIHIDPTWGVSDQDMFNRSLEELDKLNANHEPFFAMLQTLSNHMPYSLPDPLPVAVVKDQGVMTGRLTPMRYADYALGEFFEKAKQKPWYKDTLFVLVGDHGFGVPTYVTSMDLLRFHVPVLMIAPGLREKVGGTVSKVMSQVDVVPTAISLFGVPFDQQCWGRNILALGENDPGFAVIKPSGSDPRVAIIEGDKALVKQPDQKPELYHFTLGKGAKSEKLDNAALTDRLFTNLSAYLQTALRSLNNQSVGSKPGLKDIETNPSEPSANMQ